MCRLSSALSLFRQRGAAMEYKSIYGEASYSFTEQKSEFISHICHVESDEDAAGYIDKIRSENRKARHNCYAYALKEGSILRYSDDGEPQGTAGAPIMDVIQKNGLTDVVIVVTRYFGGILLGKGGLTRAYSSGASGAVSAAKIMRLLPASIIKITLDYAYYDRISYSLPEFEVKITDTEYSDKVAVTLAIRAELAEKLTQKLSDLTNGSAIIDKIDEILYDFSA